MWCCFFESTEALLVFTFFSLHPTQHWTEEKEEAEEITKQWTCTKKDRYLLYFFFVSFTLTLSSASLSSVFCPLFFALHNLDRSFFSLFTHLFFHLKLPRCCVLCGTYVVGLDKLHSRWVKRGYVWEDFTQFRLLSIRYLWSMKNHFKTR